jgi:cytochrome P450
LTPIIDLCSVDAFADGHPWEQYRWLRQHDPVHWHPEADGPGFWAVTRYDDVRTVRRQPKLYSSYARGVMMEESDEASLAASRQMMLVMDPPQHDRFKLLVSRGFTPRNAETLRDSIEALAREIVDDVAPLGECDAVTDIAGRVPSGLIAELMGIPRADGERLYELTEVMHSHASAVTPEERLGAVTDMLTYAHETAVAKRAKPGSDIMSTLVAAEVDGDRLTDEEIMWFFLLLVNAGGDTTRNLVAAGLALLFEHPDERARLQADIDGLMPTAIEEMLRYVTPVVHFRRTATADTELGGRHIAAGDKVMIFYGSANRDEAVFAEPDRFDVTREPNPHLAFGGGGPHLCLGLHVARIEIDAVLREVLRRLSDIAPAGALERLSSNFIAGIRHLPVRFTPER